MGTRGVVGFRLDGVDKMAYNHFDSYPAELGVDVVRQVHQMGEIMDLEDKVRAIKMIDERKPLDFSTAEEQRIFEAAVQYLDLSVSNQSETDPYCLFRIAQGNLLAYLEMGYMPDANEFICDSLFCEWGYIVNLDTLMLEVWRGFQTQPDPLNRYGQEKDDSGYYPCSMIAMFELEEVTEVQVVMLDREEE